jgi:Na+-translocating ferredoxin:NAD+ oxidoreductase RnfD subunit
MQHDARIWQVGVLAGILVFGLHTLDFPLSLGVIVSTLASGILSEYLCSAATMAGTARPTWFHWFKVGQAVPATVAQNPQSGSTPHVGKQRTPRPLSATISSLSVLLLFRSSVAWTYPCVVLLAVASKYCIRWRGRHWLNPTNFAVLIGTMLMPGWISSGQWGHLAVLPLALGGLGILVLLRAGRLDSALTFLTLSSALECTRILYYGYPHPVDIFIHRLNNGALWLFTFYMLTDPQTTPQARWGRMLHASLVALVSFYLTEWWDGKDTPLWALLFLAPIVPVLDWLRDCSQLTMAGTARPTSDLRGHVGRAVPAAVYSNKYPNAGVPFV